MLLPGALMYNVDRNKLSKKKTLILVYFVGGVTYGEIAALRWLAEKYNKEIVIATTNITTGKKILQSLIYNVDK